MIRIISLLLVLAASHTILNAQLLPKKFGEGIQIIGKDSSYYLKFGFRFQNLHTSSWDVTDGNLTDYRGAFLVRRSRLKFDGWSHSKKFIYKFELGLSNRDIGGGTGSEFRRSANVILDASLAYKLTKHLTIQFGQRKLPGNRERVISSGDMQFVDRSILNSLFNIDRDVGLQILGSHKIGNTFIIKEFFALSQGEGRNVTAGHFGGYGYTFKTEVFPFGAFSNSKGAYIGSALEREQTPKLAMAVSYDINNNAVRERGQLGSFVIDKAGNYRGKTLKVFFADLMFKYKGLSVMAEYAKKTSDGSSLIFDDDDTLIGTFYTGEALNIQSGILLKSNLELAARFTHVNPDKEVAAGENQYTIGISKYLVGHKLKIQTDFTYRDMNSSDNGVIWRLQTDVHF